MAFPGSDMKVNRNDRTTDTTLRDLVATMSDVAFEYAADTEEAYEIACLVLLRILKDASLKRQIDDQPVPATKYPH
jgi:hypothetical protein